MTERNPVAVGHVCGAERTGSDPPSQRGCGGMPPLPLSLSHIPHLMSSQNPTKKYHDPVIRLVLEHFRSFCARKKKSPAARSDFSVVMPYKVIQNGIFARQKSMSLRTLMYWCGVIFRLSRKMAQKWLALQKPNRSATSARLAPVISCVVAALRRSSIK